MAETTKTLRAPVLILAGILLAVPVLAAGPLADVEVGGQQVTWSPNDGKKMTLTVTGPEGFTVERTLDAEAWSLNAVAEGLADGTYNWELAAIARQRKAAADSAERGPWNLGNDGLQTGVFTVSGGQLINPDVPEARLTEKDVIHNDDVIITGSLCVGFDCVNGENFGFDTIRLKENNLRIKFQDTSNSASFPTNDWQLTANDSANGGAEKFSIDDITGGRTPFTIEASAPSHSLYVDDGGRLGLGTSTPLVDVHVVSGNTPTLRLEQNGSSGFTPQTWDVAGNEAGFFIRDVTNGSTLPFRIMLGAASQTLVIDGDDEVGIGAGTNPDEKLHVQESGCGSNGCFLIKAEADGKARIVMSDTSDGGADWTLDAEAVSSNVKNFNISLVGSGANELTLNQDGNMTIRGTLTQNSDRNRKDNITPVDPQAVLEALSQVPISTWTYKGDSSVVHLGPMAQDFYAAFGLGLGETKIATIDTSGVALASVQALHQELKAKDRKIEDLEARLAALEALLAEH